MISRETIDEIMLRNDITSLVGNYVSLKRAGSNLKGLCPFHSEKTPSFTVYPANNSFFCFGCGAGGDQITFTMKIEHLDYPDAVDFLARRAGITIVEARGGNTYTNEPKYDKARLMRMNVDAAKYFHACLFSNDPDAKAALSYFTEKRGLSLATIKHFGLGFAPNSYDKFSEYMLARGYTYDELVVGFLCGKNDRGVYYDTFRNRVMFPIIDVSGNVIAFGGRVMDDSKPKYRNTSDTPVFKKSRNLFALNYARLTCKDSLILCEGYMDVIALHVAGFTNAVATLGTAITPEQARMMSRYTKRVVICYDADEAGQTAANKALRLLEEVGLDVSVLVIPGAKDPDEYIKTYGKEKFADLINGAKSKFEYNLDSILSRYDLMLPQDRIDALHELENLIAGVYSVAERDVYIQVVAQKFGVEFASVKKDVDRIVERNTAAYKKNESRRIQQESVGYSDRINPDFIKAPSVAKHEETVLGLLLLYPEHRKKAFTEKLLSSDDFFTELGKRIFEFLLNAYENGDDNLTEINAVFSSDEMGRIARMKISRMQLTDNGTDVFVMSIEALKKSVAKKISEGNDSLDSLMDMLKRKREEN